MLASSRTVMIRSSCNGAPLSGCKAETQSRRGDTIDPDSLLHDGVLCFDHLAAGQTTITFTSLTSMNFLL